MVRDNSITITHHHPLSPLWHHFHACKSCKWLKTTCFSNVFLCSNLVMVWRSLQCLTPHLPVLGQIQNNFHHHFFPKHCRDLIFWVFDNYDVYLKETGDVINGFKDVVMPYLLQLGSNIIKWPKIVRWMMKRRPLPPRTWLTRSNSVSNSTWRSQNSKKLKMLIPWIFLIMS